MYIRTKTSKNSPRKSVQIVESVRQGDRVIQRIVRHIGVAEDEAHLEELRKLAIVVMAEEKANRQLLFDKEEKVKLFVEEYERQLKEKEMVDVAGLSYRERVVEGYEEVYGKLFSDLGFRGIFGDSDRGRGNTNLLERMVVARLAEPRSKMGTVEWLKSEEMVELNLDRLYRMMDRLHERIDKIKAVALQKTLDNLGGKVGVMLFDVTTLYYESFTEDELRRKGYSKDNKARETQVTLAMAVTEEGLPLTYELFPGDTFEGKTFEATLKGFLKAFDPEEVVIIADTGMLSDENLSYLEGEGYSYIVRGRLKGLPKAVKEGIKDLNSYDLLFATEEEEIKAKVMDLPKEGRKLIAIHSEVNSRKDAHEREEMLFRLQKALSDEDGRISSSKLIGNKGIKGYLSRKDGKDAIYVIDEKKVAEDSSWDGISGVVTNMEVGKEDVVGVLEKYKSLWRVEESFRMAKGPLRFRPMFHWKKERIESHVAICYIAFCLQRHLEHRMKVSRNEVYSLSKTRDILSKVDSVLLEDTKSGKLYRIPRTMGVEAKRIYAAVGLKKPTRPTIITSLEKYRNRYNAKTSFIYGYPI